MSNTKNLKYKILKDLYTFLSQSPYFKNINFNNIKKSSAYEKSKCLNLSKNISNYMKEHNIKEIKDSTILSLIVHNTPKSSFKIYKKHIDLIKFYTMLFTEKSCSHLTYYLYNNSNIIKMEKNKENISIVINKSKKHAIILNEHLDIFTKKYCKNSAGELFTHTKRKNFLFTLKYQAYLCVFSIIVIYLLIYNIPNNYIIMEMNLTMHMRMNHNGYVLSCKPKSRSAKVMINETKKVKGKINNTIPNFINYGLEKRILKPGEKVKIYIIGPPLNEKIFENLKNSLHNIPLDIIINNSGNLIKINST